MKKLDVFFSWQNVNVTIAYDIPRNVTLEQVEVEISKKLLPYKGTEPMPFRLESSGVVLNKDYNLLQNTTLSEIQNSINAGVAIIGGRSRRG